MATNRTKWKLTLEPAEAGEKEDLLMNYMIARNRKDQEENKHLTDDFRKRRETKKKLKVCYGWMKITSVNGLKIHQGKKRCLRAFQISSSSSQSAFQGFYGFLCHNAKVDQLSVEKQTSGHCSPKSWNAAVLWTSGAYQDALEPNPGFQEIRETSLSFSSTLQMHLALFLCSTLCSLGSTVYSGPHFKFFRVLEHITNIVKAYYQDLQLCFTMPDFTSTWQSLETGIMVGCTRSSLAFTSAMGVIGVSGQWMERGQKQGVSQQAIKCLECESPRRGKCQILGAEAKKGYGQRSDCPCFLAS